MSEPIDDGGPAFPRSSQGPSGDFDHAEGMSLRDFLAAASLIAHAQQADELGFGYDKRAKHAYAQADECLKARKS